MTRKRSAFICQAAAWALACCAPAVLGGCGFTPLYAADGRGVSASEAGLGLVSVALIADRQGQELRQALQQRLDGAGGGSFSRYDLYVTLSIAGGDIAIDRQSASTRSRQTGTAGWTLRAQDAGHTELASGAAHALDGYDVINQQFFAADLSRGVTVQRIDNALADQIVQQLAIYFRRHPPSA